MAVTIKQLHCLVRVTAETGNLTPHHTEGPARPMVHYSQPTSQTQAASEPTPSDKATEQRGKGGELEPSHVGRTDPALVAKRVHELMIEELRASRERGER